MTRKTEEAAAHPKRKSLGQRPEADLTSQAWEATSPAEQAEAAGRDEDELTPEQKRVTPEDVRKQGTCAADRPDGSAKGRPGFYPLRLRRDGG